jgi:hypothetical protein
MNLPMVLPTVDPGGHHVQYGLALARADAAILVVRSGGIRRAEGFGQQDARGEL